MASEAVLLERLLVGGAVALLMAGAAAALLSPNAIKRLAGLTIAGMGALVALVALHAPESALTAGAAILFVQLVAGAAVTVGLQENYGSIEAAEIDAADAQTEPEEPAP